MSVIYYTGTNTATPYQHGDSNGNIFYVNVPSGQYERSFVKYYYNFIEDVVDPYEDVYKEFEILHKIVEKLKTYYYLERRK